MRVCLFWCRPSLNAQGAGSFKKYISFSHVFRFGNGEDLVARIGVMDGQCACRVAGGGGGRELGKGGTVLVRRLGSCGDKKIFVLLQMLNEARCKFSDN